MISFIEGEIVDLYEDRMILKCNGIGYEIYIPASIFHKLPGIGQNVCIHTYLYVREDAMQLYGFLKRDDLNVFRLLLGVSGIGPKGALGILSVITPDELRMAILAGDAKTISKAPGIGIKTSQKLIIELKDKVDITDVMENGTDNYDIEEASEKNDAIEALTALGYSASEALRAVNSIPNVEKMDVEKILAAALKNLSREGV